MKPVEWTSEKDSPEEAQSVRFCPGIGPAAQLPPLLCLGPLLVQVGGWIPRKSIAPTLRYNAALSSLVADELGSLAFEVDLYT